MKTTYFSIILPTYNRANMLPSAIESIINQTYNDWELLIIDDGSTDNTKAIVESYKDERIIYIYQTNQERCAARNNGIKNSNGKYICFLDSDDYYLPERLDLLHKKIIELNEPKAFLFTGVCFDENGLISVRQDKPLYEFDNKYDFFMCSHVHCQQTCIEKSIFNDNKFNVRFNVAEDTELWLRIISNNDFISLEDQYTIAVVVHDDRSINVKHSNSYKKVLEVFSYMRKKYKYPFSKKVVKYMLTDCYFGISKYYIYTHKKTKAFNNMLLSIMSDLNHVQLKYRINILFNIIFNIKNAENLISN